MKRLLIVFCMFSAISLQALTINLSEMDTITVLSRIEQGKSVSKKSSFILTGTIVSMEEQDSTMIVTLLKSNWQDKNNLQSFTFKINLVDSTMKEYISSTGLQNKIVLIGKFQGIDSDGLPRFNTQRIIRI
jgi:hypothetical protein